jgi:hypothetical protein
MNTPIGIEAPLAGAAGIMIACLTISPMVMTAPESKPPRRMRLVFT